MMCFPTLKDQLRVCINFSMVNRDIQNNVYPMHRIDKKINEMTDSTLFTTLDFTKGYQQPVFYPLAKTITVF